MSSFKRGPGVPFGTSFTTQGAGPRGLSFSERRARPMSVTPFSSAFAGHTLLCPVCKIGMGLQGHRYVCEQCKGVFVENAALVEMMSAMRDEPWGLPPAEGPPGARPCPVCAAVMSSERVDAIELDRCASHGVWFDRDELAESLLVL
jgi:Zn-finger nucleic acid-binding protein